MASSTTGNRQPVTGNPYTNPYVAGIGIGLVLLASYVVVGRGLGAIGAFSSAVAGVVGTVAPAHVAANEVHAGYVARGGVLRDWLVLEIVGVTIGALVSAKLAGRFAPGIEKGPRIGSGTRLLAALGGGAIMGFGAKLARGCTSGQALSGGALLSVGSWLFIGTTFAAAFIAAPALRRLWR
ncbi:MAG TPA: YeeE/YedE thiosulfate transporter family protein [Thermoanaerobaculia bacterium]